MRDSGSQRKTGGAVGMSDKPLFQGGAIPYKLSEHKAGGVPISDLLMILSMWALMMVV